MDRLSSAGVGDVAWQIGIMWQQVRQPVVVPVLRWTVGVCLAMSVMLFAEKVYMGIVILLIRVFGKRPQKQYKWEPMKELDVELGNSAYPMVLVQIPMYNEREVITQFSLIVLVFEKTQSISSFSKLLFLRNSV